MAAVLAVAALMTTGYSTGGQTDGTSTKFTAAASCTNDFTADLLLACPKDCTNKLNAVIAECGKSCTNKFSTDLLACPKDCTNKFNAFLATCPKDCTNKFSLNLAWGTLNCTNDLSSVKI